jgi:hypothetical protein
VFEQNGTPYETPRNGGGVFIVKSNLPAYELDIAVTNTDDECLAIKIPHCLTGRHKDLVVMTYYCPPDQDLSDTVLATASQLSETNHVLLLGD